MNNLINLVLSHIASHADWQNYAAKYPNDLLYYAGSGVWKYFLFSVKTDTVILLCIWIENSKAVSYSSWKVDIKIIRYQSPGSFGTLTHLRLAHSCLSPRSPTSQIQNVFEWKTGQQEEEGDGSFIVIRWFAQSARLLQTNLANRALRSKSYSVATN